MSRPKKIVFLAALAFSIAVLLRIALALQPGLWVDEIFSLAMATGHSLEHPAAGANPGLGDYIEPRQAGPPSTFRRFMEHETPPAGPGRVIRAVLLSDTNPPLYYLLLGLWTRFTGTSDAALRLFSALWALACLPLLWSLGHEVGDRKTAWAVCLLFAFSPPAIYYSAEGRMYSLVWFLALGLAWSSFGLTLDGPRPYVLVLWVLSAAAGLLTHYFSGFVLAACFFWLWFHPDKIPRAYLAGAVVLVGLLVLPWYLRLPESLIRWRVTAGWLDHPLTRRQALSAPFLLAWSYLSGVGIWGGSRWANLFMIGLYTLLIVTTLRRGGLQLIRGPRQLLWLWVLSAVFGVLLLDLIRNTNASLVARYVLSGLPAGLLLAAAAISRLPGKVYVCILLLIVLAWVPGTRAMFAKSSRPWEPFPELSRHLTDWARPDDLIIVHSIPSGVLGVARYLDTSVPIASWVVQLDQRKIPGDMYSLTSNRRRVALVKVHDMGRPSPAEVWLREHMTLARQERVGRFAEILYFLKE